MRHLKRKEGFTLIELVVSIGTAAVVMAAAASFLLMATRTQRDIRDAAQEQQTIRIVLTMLENLATEGGFDKVEPIQGGWALKKNGSDASVITYVDGKLFGAGGGELLTDLKVAHAELNGQVLTFSFETDISSYTSSVYCRLITPITTGTMKEQMAAGDISPIKDAITSGTTDKVGLTGNEADARFAFLATLCKEYGSTGQIKGSEKYYSEWYIGDYTTNPGWNSSTPWCACFLSWAAQGITGAPRFADVDVGYKWFKDNNKFKTSAPTPGDYIFFDWEAGRTNTNDTPHDPDHVGAVLYVSGGTVYTIEGNSGGRVAIRSYALDDQRILGYGVLPWAS